MRGACVRGVRVLSRSPCLCLRLCEVSSDGAGERASRGCSPMAVPVAEPMCVVPPPRRLRSAHRRAASDGVVCALMQTLPLVPPAAAVPVTVPASVRPNFGESASCSPDGALGDHLPRCTTGRSVPRGGHPPGARAHRAAPALQWTADHSQTALPLAYARSTHCAGAAEAGSRTFNASRNDKLQPAAPLFDGEALPRWRNLRCSYSSSDCHALLRGAQPRSGLGQDFDARIRILVAPGELDNSYQLLLGEPFLTKFKAR